jgi:hypothetical protein
MSADPALDVTVTQGQRCAGCGAAGHPPTIVYDRALAPPGVVLTPVFGWLGKDTPVLLCRDCRSSMYLERARQRGRR